MIIHYFEDKTSWFYHSLFGKINCGGLLLWNLKGKINSGKMWIIPDLQTEMWRCWGQVLECKRMNWKLRLLIKALNQKSKHVRTWTRPDRDLIRNARLNPARVYRGAWTPTRLGDPGCQMSVSFSASLRFIDPGHWSEAPSICLIRSLMPWKHMAGSGARRRGPEEGSWDKQIMDTHTHTQAGGRVRNCGRSFGCPVSNSWCW